MCGLLRYSGEKLLFHKNNLPLKKGDTPLSPPFFKGGEGDYWIIKGLITCLLRAFYQLKYLPLQFREEPEESCKI